MNALNTRTAGVIDPILSNHARGYRNASFIADALFPRVPVPSRSMTVLKFGKESFRKLNTRRAPGSNVKRIQYGYASDDAGNLIDGYIATRYTTPLPAVPRLVSTWAVSIARYILFRNGAPDHVAQDYKDAIAALKDVQAGRLALPVTPGVEPPAELTGRVMACHPPEVFTAARLRGWR